MVEIMEYRKPERDVIKAWRLKRLIGLLIFSAGFAAAIAAVALSGGKTAQLLIAAALGIIVIYEIIGLIVYPLIEYRQWKYMVSDERVEIIHGIFYIKRNVIPVVRIQNITIKQGPIYRKYGLYTVEIALASGSFEITGLGKQTAEDISRSIREKLYDRLNDREAV